MAVSIPTVDVSTDRTSTVLGTNASVPDRSLPRPWGWCERPRAERVNPVTGEVEQDRCNTNRCSGCVVRRAYKVELAITAAAPTHLVTLTLAGTDWKAANQRWSKLRRKLAKIHSFRAAYVVEIGGAGDQLHIHVLWAGRAPTAETLSEAAQEVGLGWDVDVRPIHDLEGVAKYLTKQVHEGRATEHLRINGNRLIHATKGFWTLDGEIVRGGWAQVARNVRGRSRGASTQAEAA